ncbi:uncharacterized protein B0H64DRAFT_374877 [Chaetomium fimeti]|uniref:Aminoglycoside phosphotransferase domain-containing protein n=1 Tax=Chaetomium fimeti TaxID=1854472 RepID=A0AAE0HCQ7_9PEZI|nr:hypothetical protein B0H64DRAFT_374877 [Chaetomium fimeti]
MHRLLRAPFAKCCNSARATQLPLACHYTTTTTTPVNNTTPDWDSDEGLFTFTRGRFLYDENRQMAQRTVRFSMSRLARAAAASIGADRCVHVQKCPDGLYNKAYIFRMDDGREVIGKVPNPNAGLPHYTTASEVATMDFTNSVGAEYIIMEKAEGVPLGRVWNSLGAPDKSKLLRQVFRFTNAWLANPLPGYGGLYYANDLPSGRSIPIGGTQFAIGPTVGRDWCDAGRKGLECDRGPWGSALEYRRAIGVREQAAVHNLPQRVPQWAMLTGPGLYQPSPSNKLSALAAYLQVLDHVLPQESDAELQDILPSRLWHDDLHAENIFVNPSEPTQITAIIDWHSTQAAPLFDHTMDPSFLEYDGPEIGDDLSKPAPLDTTGVPEEEKAAMVAAYIDRALMIAWRGLLRSRNPAQYHTIKFQDTTAGHILQAARRAYEAGEAHLAVLILDLRDAWPADAGADFPVTLSEQEAARIRRATDEADRGAGLVVQAKAQLGDRWPENGLVEHEAYEETRALLTYVRDEMAEQCFGGDEVAEGEFVRGWPFES